MSAGTTPLRSRRWVAVGTVGLALVIADHCGWLLKHGPDDMTAYHGAVVRVSRVIDGGTIEITLPDRMHDRPFTVVRLWGIDCPRAAGRERYAEPLASAARDLTGALAAGRTVVLTLETHRTRGPLGQVLAHVRLVGGISLNERILAEGLARTDERWPHARLTRYAQVERAARRKGVGVWGRGPRYEATG